MFGGQAINSFVDDDPLLLFENNELFLGFFISSHGFVCLFKSLLDKVGSRKSDGSCADCRNLSERNVSDTFGTGTVSLHCADVCAL